MRLSQSHDIGYKFYRLTQVDLGCILIYFLRGYLDFMTRVTDLTG
jgi:hypothetical protein